MTEKHCAQLCVSDPVTATMEDLQRTLGQGPSLDASRICRPVMAPNLASAESSPWPAFDAAAVEAGIRAVFAFPLQVGAARVGALTLYRDRPGPLSRRQQADARCAAIEVTRWILAAQGQAVANRLAVTLDRAGTESAALHQASGMISVQLGIGVVESLDRLRGHAYATGRPIRSVAADVVARQLRLDS